MSLQPLPDSFDEHIAGAVRAFWALRSAEPIEARQGGARDSVLGGKNMAAFHDVILSVAMHCGLPASSVLTGSRKTILPGFYRPTKNWDTLVIHKERLIAVFEFKSQVGSFGNNFNNRSEEAIGSAADLWVAHERHAFRRDASAPPDPRPPFVGWLMLLEDCPDSRRPVRFEEPHFRAFPEFRGASCGPLPHPLRAAHGASALHRCRGPYVERRRGQGERSARIPIGCDQRAEPVPFVRRPCARRSERLALRELSGARRRAGSLPAVLLHARAARRVASGRSRSGSYGRFFRVAKIWILRATA